MPVSDQSQMVSTRVGILLLVTIGTIINFLHRIVIGGGAPAIAPEFGISTAMMGPVFSAFKLLMLAASQSSFW